MSMRVVIESIEYEMFDRATKRNCGNCKWWAENGVCVCDKSDEVANFTGKDFSCPHHEYTEKE